MYKDIIREAGKIVMNEPQVRKRFEDLQSWVDEKNLHTSHVERLEKNYNQHLDSIRMSIAMLQDELVEVFHETTAHNLKFITDDYNERLPLRIIDEIEDMFKQEGLL